MGGKARLAADIFETALDGLTASNRRRTVWTKKGYRRQTQKEADDEADGLKKWLADAEADPRSLKREDIKNWSTLRLKAMAVPAVAAVGIGKYAMRDDPAPVNRKRR